MDKYQKGVIQIPILIAIVVGVVAVGGGGIYLATTQNQGNEAQNPAQQESLVQEEQPADTEELSEIEQLRQELDELKQAASVRSAVPGPAPTPKPQPTPPPPAPTGTGLSNADIINRIKPATVFIDTTEGTASGMIIESNGYLLTNAHVVSGVSSVEVTLFDGRSFAASVTGKDEIADIALLKINASNLAKVNFGDSDSVSPGDEVFAFGYPFGIEGDVSFKEGTVSRKVTESGAEYIETSTEIHSGNSGGPLVNKHGQVIGINAATFGESIAGVFLGETIKFAIPINIATFLIGELKAGKVVIDTEQAERKEFSKFDEALDDIIKESQTGYDLLESAELQLDAQNYADAANKIGDAIVAFEATIQKLQTLNIPDVPFSDTINELLKLYVKEYEYEKTVAGYSQSMVETIVTLNESSLNHIVYMKAERSKVLDEARNFYETELEPKIDEYNEKSDAYLE